MHPCKILPSLEHHIQALLSIQVQGSYPVISKHLLGKVQTSKILQFQWNESRAEGCAGHDLLFHFCGYQVCIFCGTASPGFASPFAVACLRSRDLKQQDPTLEIQLTVMPEANQGKG